MRVTKSKVWILFFSVVLVILLFYALDGLFDQEPVPNPILKAHLHQTLTGHSEAARQVAFSPDGLRLASSGEDKTVRLWRLSDGAPLQTLTGHALNVWSVAFSPDSHLLATGGDDSSIKLWRVKDGSLMNTLTGGSEHVYSVAFSPDGRWLASGSREKGNLGTMWKQLAGERLSGDKGRAVRLWQVSDGSLQQALAEHSDDVHSVTFSPDGQWLASSGDDKTVKLWRLESLPPSGP